LPKYKLPDETELARIKELHRTFLSYLPKYADVRKEKYFVTQQVAVWEQYRKSVQQLVAQKQRRVNVMLPNHPNRPKEMLELQRLQNVTLSIVEDELARLYSFVSTYNKTVTVQFDSNDQVDTAQRWFAKNGAVQDQNGTANPLGTTSGTTDAPDLTSVSRDSGDTQYDYKFDENVGDLSASDFVLYTNDGTQIQAEDITTDGDVVHADFKSEIKDYPKDIITAAVVPANADNSGDTSDSSNGTVPTIGEVSLGSSNVTRSGRTTGPDLTSVSHNAGDQTITLTFDEKLDDSNENSDGSGIYLATSDNRLVQADSIESVNGHKVYVKANKTDIKALEGVVIDAGTVTDKAGNDNALTSEIWGSGDTVTGSGSGLYSSHSTT